MSGSASVASAGGAVRRASKVDGSQAEIVDALRKAGVAVWVIKEPCDLLTWFRGMWKPLECKPAPEPGIRVKTRAIRKRNDQERQSEFVATYGVPVVRTAQEALQAVGGYAEGPGRCFRDSGIKQGGDWFNETGPNELRSL